MPSAALSGAGALSPGMTADFTMYPEVLVPEVQMTGTRASGLCRPNSSARAVTQPERRRINVGLLRIPS